MFKEKTERISRTDFPKRNIAMEKISHICEPHSALIDFFVVDFNSHLHVFHIQPHCPILFNVFRFISKKNFIDRF